MEKHYVIKLRYHGHAGRQNVANVARAAFTCFSNKAANHFDSHPEHELFYVKTSAPKSALAHVTDWMRAQADNSDPTPLPCPDEFEEAVWVLEVCRALSVYQHLRGQALEDGLKEYIRMAPLTVQEFAMVFEVVGHVKELRQLAIEETAGRFKEGGAKGVPGLEEIREYCEKNGIELDGGDGGGVNADRDVKAEIEHGQEVSDTTDQAAPLPSASGGGEEQQRDDAD